jgi:hypothetical protein
VSRELLVGLATALLAIATTGAALWSPTPRRPAVPDAIELRVTESAARQWIRPRHRTVPWPEQDKAR